MFYAMLPKRMAKFNLQLAEEKTRILEFGRFATENRRARSQGKPETFSFLGFTFYCSMNSRKTFFRVKVKTDRKKMISKIKKFNIWIKENRHMKICEIMKRINQSLRGHYQYYGVTDNARSLERFFYTIVGLLFKWLNRRSQKRSYILESFKTRVLERFGVLMQGKRMKSLEK